ncbi:MAG TPA: hypothetical protein VFO89_14650 [Thermoanaerobaculia bacterium]|nr:hypothetical protein [Thermoanaerobaculia bacterium]
MRVLKVIGSNLAVVLFFLLVLLVGNVLSGRITTHWVAYSISAVIASVLALAAAVRVNARWAAPLMAVNVGYSVTGLIIYSVFGHQAAQGAPTHIAVMLAAAIGVVLGWYLLSRDRKLVHAS